MSDDVGGFRSDVSRRDCRLLMVKFEPRQKSWNDQLLDAVIPQDVSSNEVLSAVQKPREVLHCFAEDVEWKWQINRQLRSWCRG